MIQVDNNLQFLGMVVMIAAMFFSGIFSVIWMVVTLKTGDRKRH